MAISYLTGHGQGWVHPKTVWLKPALHSFWLDYCNSLFPGLFASSFLPPFSSPPFTLIFLYPNSEHTSPLLDCELCNSLWQAPGFSQRRYSTNVWEMNKWKNEIPCASHYTSHCSEGLPCAPAVHSVHPYQRIYSSVCNCLFTRLEILWGQRPHLSGSPSLTYLILSSLHCFEGMNGWIFHWECIFLPSLTSHSAVIHWAPTYVQGSDLGIRNLTVSKTDKNSCFNGAYILVGKTVDKYTDIHLYKQMTNSDKCHEEKWSRTKA